MSTVGTPDYQRGVASAQILLASKPGSTAFLIVGVPPNAETLIVLAEGYIPSVDLAVTGVTTGIAYPGVAAVAQKGVTGSSAWYFDVSSASDSEVEILFTTEPGTPWVVVADSAARVTVDASKQSSRTGLQYVVPVAPSPLADDHPPTELAVVATGGLASGATLLSAPGLGNRWRIFYAIASAQIAAASVELRDSVTGNNFLVDVSAAAGNPTPMDFKPSGLPLSANAAITVVTSTGTAVAAVVYTVENV